MKKESCIIIFVVSVIIPASALYAEEPKIFRLGVMSSFTGTFASVAETQKKGVLLKVGQINSAGGLNMPWGKVKIETVIRDDKADIPTGVALFKEMVGKDGIHALIGLTYNPLVAAINHECKTSPTLFLPACVPASDSFRKGNPADGTFSVAFTPWSIGYLAGGCAIKTLAKKNIYFLSRSDSWGSSTLEGLKKASETFGGKIIGVSETEKIGIRKAFHRVKPVLSHDIHIGFADIQKMRPHRDGAIPVIFHPMHSQHGKRVLMV